MKQRNLTGERFGRWLVHGPGQDKVYPSGRRNAYWACECDCGTKRNVCGQVLKTGDSKSCGCLQLEMRTPTREKDIDRLMDSMLILPWCGCWIFDPDTTSDRGSFWLNGKVVGPSRAAYELLVGAIPEGLDVCHHCDIGVCINPDHLFVGTASDNLLDCSRKGRLGGCVVRTEVHQATEPKPLPERRKKANGLTPLALAARRAVS